MYKEVNTKESDKTHVSQSFNYCRLTKHSSCAYDFKAKAAKYRTYLTFHMDSMQLAVEYLARLSSSISSAIEI